MLKFIIDRLKERSTWIGLTSIVAAAGVTLNPEQVAAISIAGVALAGVIAVFTKGN